MEKRSIGSLSVPVVGIGCNNFGRPLDQEGTTAVVDAAFEAGCTFFDTADMYSKGTSEEFLGRSLVGRRDRAQVATKFGLAFGDQQGGASPAYVKEACRKSLERLGTDWLDLFQLHAPDPDVPMAETLGALNELVEEGLVREIGCSNFTPALLAEASAATPGGRFASVQNQYSLLWREPENGLLEALDAEGATLLPYYPLANGLLTGKYGKGQPIPEGTRLATMGPERAAHWLGDHQLEIVEDLRGVSEDTGLEMVTLAISWLLSRPQVACVIAGATKVDQVRANASAAVALDPEVIARLDELTASR